MGRMLTLNPEERITAKEVKHRVITAEHGVITMRRRVIAMQALAHEYFTEAPPPKAHHLMPTYPSTHASKGRNEARACLIRKVAPSASLGWRGAARRFILPIHPCYSPA